MFVLTFAGLNMNLLPIDRSSGFKVRVCGATLLRVSVAFVRACPGSSLWYPLGPGWQDSFPGQLIVYGWWRPTSGTSFRDEELLPI